MADDTQTQDAQRAPAAPDVSTEVGFIWGIASTLRGTYTAEKYRDVIIPMSIIRRFECALESTKDAVLKAHKQNPALPAPILLRISGQKFYNTSKYSLRELCTDPAHLGANFESYIEGFSDNVRDVIRGLEFSDQIRKMEKGGCLFPVVKEFSELDLSVARIDSVRMGYIFEELIRRFSENAEAGDHYTGRDIVRLMAEILLSEGADDAREPYKVINILDQACGTGGMLSVSCDMITRANPTAKVVLFGQELIPESYAMCVAEMLIKGQDERNIRNKNTLLEDCFPETKMQFVIENPPFGKAWGGKEAPTGQEAAVRAEFEKGAAGRWGAGLPGTGDSQMLFLQSAVDKLAPNGRCAIIQNGSPLFSGGTSSGESQIRRSLLERDLIEAIIALPTDLFYNTGIATYIWILSKNKREARRGRVQLIDAGAICHKLRKALGNKRNELTEDDRARIVKLYTDFAECPECKIFDTTDFMYREYTVRRPLRRNYTLSDERIERADSQGGFDGFGRERDAVIAALKSAPDKALYKNKAAFEAVLRRALGRYAEAAQGATPAEKRRVAAAVEDLLDALGVRDDTADVQCGKDGEPLPDPLTRDTEIVPYKERVEDYMAREVLPHMPDAMWEFEEKLSAKKPVIKTGAEIPFTRYFYKYARPRPASEILSELSRAESAARDIVSRIMSEASS